MTFHAYLQKTGINTELFSHQGLEGPVVSGCWENPRNPKAVSLNSKVYCSEVRTVVM